MYMHHKFRLCCRIGHVLSCISLMQVEFVGEQGSDTGGMTREFFTYVGHAMSTRYLTQTGCFKAHFIRSLESVRSLNCLKHTLVCIK